MAHRFTALSAALLAAIVCSACVFAPGSSPRVADSVEMTRMSEQALATCGAGQVREVNAKSFTCK